MDQCLKLVHFFSTILLAVYSKNLVDRDDFLGEARVPLSEFRHFHQIDSWFPLADLVSVNMSKTIGL